jgi:hypothetical protein
MWLRKLFVCVALAALLSSSGCWCHQCHRRERWRDGCPCETGSCAPSECGCGAPGPTPLVVGPSAGPTMMMPPANPR